MAKIEQLRSATSVKQSRKTRTAQAVPHAPVTVHSAESELDLAHSDFARARDRLLDAAGFGAKRSWPDWVRTACAYVAAFCVGYGIGMIFTALIDAALLATGITGLLAVLVWIIGFAIAVVIAAKLGQYVGLTIDSGAVDGYIAAKYTATKSFITSIFDRKEISCA